MLQSNLGVIESKRTGAFGKVRCGSGFGCKRKVKSGIHVQVPAGLRSYGLREIAFSIFAICLFTVTIEPLPLQAQELQNPWRWEVGGAADTDAKRQKVAQGSTQEAVDYYDRIALPHS